MIKIGNAYFNEDHICAIQFDARGSSANVYLSSDSLVTVSISEAEFQQALENAGLIDAGPDGDGTPIFTNKENVDLWDAFDKGYLFVAKDKSGQVYAYSERPVKLRSEWAYQGEDFGTLRIGGVFDALSFDDDEPLDLAAYFEVEVE